MPDFLHGRFVAEKDETAWWARAIFESVRKPVTRKRNGRSFRDFKTVYTCSLVFNRQGARGTDNDREALNKRLNAAKRIEKALKKAGDVFFPGDYEVFQELYRDKFLFVWGYQMGGYVYLYAAPVREEP